MFATTQYQLFILHFTSYILMRTQTTKSINEIFRQCFLQVLRQHGKDLSEDASDQELCEEYEAMSRQDKYGFFPAISVLMECKTAIWCAKHYHNSFKRNLFSKKLSKETRAHIRNEVMRLSEEGYELRDIFFMLQQRFSDVYQIDLYAIINQRVAQFNNE